ncbi:unnamed protein product [Polarella glacialis]|uniref:ribonuclease H n=1 Tax=Polarella glacialis TaxID=89957 RepID=A0A813FAX2_POLGL|nr:unnamed protein product [Polarella glacialis]
MRGLEAGVDRTATLTLLDAKRTSPEDKGFLHTILSGAVMTRHRLCRAQLCPDNVCQFCDSEEVENEQHLWWVCTAWRDVRSQHIEAMLPYSESWPTCFRWCGIMPESNDAFVSLGEWFSEGDARQACALSALAGRTQELVVDGCVVVFTDGACRNNQDARFRRAGFGAYWFDNSPQNISCELEGWAQTNNRAELMAVIVVAEQEPRAVIVRTDSKYVRNGVQHNLAGWRESGWRGVCNADLWQRLDDALRARTASFRTTKVRGHSNMRHVKLGLVALEDMIGNNAADALATQGADRHRVDRETLLMANNKRFLASAVQRMMVAILQARAACATQACGPHSRSTSRISISDESMAADFPEHSTDVNLVIISDSEDEVQAPLAAYSEQPARHSSHPISAAPVFTVPRHASQLSSSFSYTGRSAPAAPD